MVADKHFTATGFLVRNGTVLLLKHRKLGMWLPFGGHIDPGEDPIEALHREAREETGFEIEIVGEQLEIAEDAVTALPRPETILLERIEPSLLLTPHLTMKHAHQDASALLPYVQFLL